MTINSAYGTHSGLVREHNEDSYLARPDIGLWAVTDGMGGHLGGEIASRIVVTELARRVESGESLPDAVAATHHAVLDAVDRGEGQRGMGATVVAIKVSGTRYQVAWVGDSRAYLLGKHGLRQLTRDHSFVQQLLDAGAITQSEVATHPDRSVVMQAIGTEGVAEVKAEVIEGQFHKGDQILLCSDGLSSEVGDQTISDILSASGDQASKIKALIVSALDNGGADNVTVVLVSAPDDAPEHPSRGSTVPIDSNRLNQVLAGNKRWHQQPAIWVALAGVLLSIILVVIWLLPDKAASLPVANDINVNSRIQ
jgi:protein phosphatase